MSGIDSTVQPTGLINLAPDLTRLGNQAAGQAYVSVIGIDTTGAPTNILTLAGHFSVSLLRLSGMLAENITVTLTVDGEIKFNQTFTANTTGVIVFGNASASNSYGPESFEVKASLTLDVEMATDTSINFDHLVRPIV